MRCTTPTESGPRRTATRTSGSSCCTRLTFDPTPALAFVLSSDVDGDQWRFFKFPLEDLRALYGIDVAELNPWQGLEYHIETHLRAGRFLTAEVDSWYLPDTAGVSYGLDHAKSPSSPT